MLHTKTIGSYTFKVHISDDSLWVSVRHRKSGAMAFRAAFAAGAELELVQVQVEKTDNQLDIHLSAGIGKLKVRVQFIAGEFPILHYTTTLQPSKPLLFPFWPRDILLPEPEKASGKVHVHQIGIRSGLLFMELKKPQIGSVLYFQDLTALQDFCEQTQTSCAERVGGQWPEVGFTLPEIKEKPLAEGKEVVISDAYVDFDSNIRRTEGISMAGFLQNGYSGSG